MADKNVIVECYGDSLLIKQLGYDFLAVHSGIGEVANQMKKYFNNRFAIGIYDADKSSIPSYFTKNVQTIANTTHSVQLIKCQGQFHYIIKIVPAFEGFITTAGLVVDCSREEFKLPTDEKLFRDLCKNKDLHKNHRMINYVNKIISRNPPQIQTLRQAISTAFEHKPK